VRELIFPVRHDSDTGLQVQLRRQLVDAILDGRLTAVDPLPSCRRLAQSLGISRNTVVLAYQALADEGLLISRERVGYFVNPEVAADQVETEIEEDEPPGGKPQGATPPDLWSNLRIHPSEQSHITKPRRWRHYPYPFIYGQADPDLFPVAAWRMCSRQALAVQAIAAWTEDSFGEDDPMLLEEVRTRVLPRRGIKAAPGEILITLGAQNALFLIAQLLAGAPAPRSASRTRAMSMPATFSSSAAPSYARSRSTARVWPSTSASKAAIASTSRRAINRRPR